jgi:hypothetical protein
VLIAKSLFILVTCLPIITGFFACQVKPVQAGLSLATLPEGPFLASTWSFNHCPHRDKTPEYAYFIDKKLFF